jgi:hypothetical protein
MGPEDSFAQNDGVKRLAGGPGRARDLGMPGVFSDGLGAAKREFNIAWSTRAVAVSR